MNEDRPEKVAMFSAVNFRPGFQITFDNGYRASVQWGVTSYCGRAPSSLAACYKKDPFENGSNVEAFSIDAEIAAFNPKGDFCAVNNWFPAYDDVRGYCTPAEVLKFLNDVAAMKE